MAKKVTLERENIRQILQRHLGSIQRIAELLGVSHTTVSLCLSGKTTSKRIMEAAHGKAIQLLEQEQASANSTTHEELKRTA
jgi:predicted transcriptional regulator